MKIGIDARWIFREISGIGTYTLELIRHLTQVDSDNEYTLFFSDQEVQDRTLRDLALAKGGRFVAHTLPFGLFSLPNQVRMPGLLKSLGIDVFHSTNYMIPLPAFPRDRRGKIRCLTTLHDLIPLVFPEYVPRSRKKQFFALYRMLMLEVARRSDLILTVSRNSKEDILKHLRIPASRADDVVVIPEGVSPRFKPLSRADRRPGQKAILWVGRADPYKNVEVLIRAFARLREQYRGGLQLKLVGPKDARYPEASRLATELGIDKEVVWAGYLGDEDLVKAYQDADLFMLPSLYEGFGLPVLEAMACGTPVICSTKGSLSEVAGTAAIRVQPNDVIGMAEAMKRVLVDNRMAQDLSERGLRHAEKFSWTRTAQMTLNAYCQAIA